jgi:hypothetical protein
LAVKKTVVAPRFWCNDGPLALVILIEDSSVRATGRAYPVTSAKELRQRWSPERAADAREALESWKKPKRLERRSFTV